MGRVGWAIGVGIISEGMPLAFLSYYRVYPQSPLLTVSNDPLFDFWGMEASGSHLQRFYGTGFDVLLLF